MSQGSPLFVQVNIACYHLHWGVDPAVMALEGKRKPIASLALKFRKVNILLLFISF